MNLKSKLLLGVAALSMLSAKAETPAYLDPTKPIEVRVEDALSRMTTEEKVAMLHAQSKFSSPGVPRLGIPETGRPTALTESVRKWNGTNGAVQDGPTTPVRLSRR